MELQSTIPQNPESMNFLGNEMAGLQDYSKNALTELMDISNAQQAVETSSDIAPTLQQRLAEKQQALRLAETEGALFEKQYFNLLQQRAIDLSQKKQKLMDQAIRPHERRAYLQGTDAIDTLFNVLDYAVTGGIPDAYGVPTTQIIDDQLNKQYEIDKDKRAHIFNSYNLVNNSLKETNSSIIDFKKMILNHAEKMLDHKIKIKELEGKEAEREHKQRRDIVEAIRKQNKDEADKATDEAKIEMEQIKEEGRNNRHRISTEVDHLKSEADRESQEAIARARVGVQKYGIDTRAKTAEDDRVLRGAIDIAGMDLDRSEGALNRQSQMDRAQLKADTKISEGALDREARSLEGDKNRDVSLFKSQQTYDSQAADREARRIEKNKDRMLELEKLERTLQSKEKLKKMGLSDSTIDSLEKDLKKLRKEKLQREKDNLNQEKINKVRLGERDFNLIARSDQAAKRIKEDNSLRKVNRVLDIYIRMVAMSDKLSGAQGVFNTAQSLVPGSKIYADFKNLQIEAQKIKGPHRQEIIGTGSVSDYEQKLLEDVLSIQRFSALTGVEKRKFRKSIKDYLGAIESSLKDDYVEDEEQKTYLNRINTLQKELL